MFDDGQMNSYASIRRLHTETILANCSHLPAPSDQDDIMAVLLQSPTDDPADSARTIDHKSHRLFTDRRD
jgi:hypothetical protein